MSLKGCQDLKLCVMAIEIEPDSLSCHVPAGPGASVVLTRFDDRYYHSTPPAVPFLSFFGSCDALIVRGRPINGPLGLRRCDRLRTMATGSYQGSRRIQADSDLYIVYNRLLSPLELETADECLMC